MAKRMKKTTIATLTSSLSEAKRTLAPLTKKLASIAALISETEKALGGFQEIADGVIVVRKTKATRGKAKKKAGRPAGKKKAGRPAGKKKGSGISSQLKAYRKKAGVNIASVWVWGQGRSNTRIKTLKKIEMVLGRKAKKAGKSPKTRKVAKATPKAPDTPPAPPETLQV